MVETQHDAPGMQPGLDPAEAAREKGAFDCDLEEYPSAIRAALTELHTTRKLLPKLYDARKEAEEALREVIRPQYPNQPARDAAFRAQKESDPEWAEANAAEQQALDQVAALEGELEELRGHFAVALLQSWAAIGQPGAAPVGKVIVAAGSVEVHTCQQHGLDKS
jgi:hypothetical protein